jgi:2-polyprenyl-3-methyl-5-hydroxy-6-metoxy-1,4-benzoquinol methylase
MEAIEYLKEWRKVNKDRLLASKKHQIRLRKCAEFMKGETYADVGCAEGHSTNIMNGMNPGKWTGIDFCEETINIARNNFKNIQFQYLESIPQLIQKKLKFDSVVCSEVIEHVEDDELLIHCLREITKYNLIMTTPCRKVISVGHLRTYNYKMLDELFDDYENYRIEKDDHFFYVMMEKK